MNYWNIAVVPYPGLDSVAEKIRKRLTVAWTSRPEAQFIATDLDDLDQSLMERLDAVVLVADAAARHGPFVRPLAMLDELHVPVLALLDTSPEAGSLFESASALVEDRSTPGPVLCARIHGLLHRQREVNRLRRDIAVARRSHGGLQDQVARMHDELEIAAHAQREFLPRELPGLHGVTLGALWRPAQYVSGDIYDVIQLDQDHLGLFLADAVGHGVAAALMTIVISQSLTTKVAEGSSWRILGPAEVLTRLNDQMIGRRIHPTRFATAVYAVVDCRSRRLSIAAAGHPSPLVVRGDGRTESLDTSGGLMGVFDDEGYEQVEVELGVGDRLLLYSDGFEQAFPRDGEADPHRVPTTKYRDEFQKLSALKSPGEMIDAIQRRLDVQSGSLHQVDDLTLICLHAGPLSPTEAMTASEPVHV